ncbi:MAG: hypothetical protein AAB360_02665 [Patescibacteria group bacterium]
MSCILMLDDDPNQIDILGLIFEGQGHKAFLAFSPERAIEIIGAGGG